MPGHSSRPSRPAKPNKPYPDFPKFPHATGHWANKISVKLHCFGFWAGPKAALARYRAQQDDLHAGRNPRAIAQEGPTVKEMANVFLNTKQERVATDELSPRTWEACKEAATVVVTAFGRHRSLSYLQPADFASLRVRMAKRWGVHRLSNTIQFVRSLFKHAYETGLLDRPMRFGPDFRRPSKKAIRDGAAAGG